MAIVSCILFILCVIGLCSCQYINKKLGLKNDNALEQGAEQVIKEKTGVDIDLTPEDVDSKE